MNIKKTALVTGAGRGIGAAIAKALSKDYHVYVNYKKNSESANIVVSEIKKTGGTAESIKADVSNPKDVSEMFEHIKDIDVLVNNAHGKLRIKSFMKMEWSDFDEDIATALKAAYLNSKHALEIMKKKKSGKIINIASIAATGIPPKGMSSYVSAKSAMLGLTKALAVEFEKYGIKIFSISPDLTDTDMVKFIPDAIRSEMGKSTRGGRIGTPEDVARLVLKLVSEDSSEKYNTGNNIIISGGTVL